METARFRDIGRGVLCYTSWKRPGQADVVSTMIPSPAHSLAWTLAFSPVAVSRWSFPDILFSQPALCTWTSKTVGRVGVSFSCWPQAFCSQSSLSSVSLVAAILSAASALASFGWALHSIPTFLRVVTEKLHGSVVYLLIYLLLVIFADYTLIVAGYLYSSNSLFLSSFNLTILKMMFCPLCPKFFSSAAF